MIAVLVIGGVLLLAMIGVSWYGWVTLPADALVPIHFGASHNNFVSKRLGLIVHPARACWSISSSPWRPATRPSRRLPSSSRSSCASC
jgi:hypothetical protein